METIPTRGEAVHVLPPQDLAAMRPWVLADDGHVLVLGCTLQGHDRPACPLFTSLAKGEAFMRAAALSHWPLPPGAALGRLTGGRARRCQGTAAREGWVFYIDPGALPGAERWN